MMMEMRESNDHASETITPVFKRQKKRKKKKKGFATDGSMV